MYTLDVSADDRANRDSLWSHQCTIVTISGDATTGKRHAWAYVGSNDAFTVAAAGSLVISSVAIQGSLSAIGGGGTLSLQWVGGSISGLAVADSIFVMDAASTATLGGTIRFENAGVVALAEKTIVAGSSLTVYGAGTELSLSSCTLDAAVSGQLQLQLLRLRLCLRLRLRLRLRLLLLLLLLLLLGLLLLLLILILILILILLL